MRRKARSAPDPKKAEIWRSHLERAASAPSVGTYCKEHRISTSLLSYWRRRLSEPAAPGTPRPRHRRKIAKSPFVRVVAAAPEDASTAVTKRVGARIAAHGVVVEFDTSADPAWAAGVIAAMGGRP